MTHPVKAPKKLIEVALPLDAINVASAREKQIRHGHPSTLHLWWARRPLAAARAVIFGQMVNDPSWKWEVQHPGEIPPNNLKASWAASRKRLFSILEDLVKWESTTNEEILEKARAEIRNSWRESCELNKDHPQAIELFNPDKLPGLHDPFAGGGTIPLEAQRLGLDAYASDLNPVAVLINKAMVEIPPKFAGRPPVNPDWQRVSPGEKLLRQWQGAQGLAEDVRYYGQCMRDEAWKRIGHLYPPVEVTPEMAQDRPDIKPLIGQKLIVIAWLWVRCVKSPNPAFRHVDVPLASTFILSSKDKKEVYVEPIIEGDHYRFIVKSGEAPSEAKNGTKLARGSFKCLLSNTPFTYSYIDDEANAGRMGARLVAIVAEGTRGRVYLAPTVVMEAIAKEAVPTWKPDTPCRGTWASNAQGRIYGFTTFGDYFTARQLVALTTFSDLVTEARETIHKNTLTANMPDDDNRLDAGGTGATAYADAVAVYLSFAVSKAADRNTSLCFWEHAMDRLRGTFGRQALPMIWDYAETNPFAGAGGDIYGTAHSLCEVLDKLPIAGTGTVAQADAAVQSISAGRFISTDPPYYDNVAYADLSDFFYVWLRRAMKPVFPELFATLAVPKTEELIAAPYRHRSKEKAEAFFL